LTSGLNRGHPVPSSLRRNSPVAPCCRGFLFGNSTIVRDRATGPRRLPLDLVVHPRHPVAAAPVRSPVTSTIVRVVFAVPVGCGFVPNDTFFIFLCFLCLTLVAMIAIYISTEGGQTP
jgi:hypothetical protein